MGFSYFTISEKRKGSTHIVLIDLPAWVLRTRPLQQSLKWTGWPPGEVNSSAWPFLQNRRGERLVLISSHHRGPVCL